MNLQVLVSTMHQTDHSLLEKMNIHSDAIIVNQCDKNEFEEFEYKGRRIKFFSFAERGVGLSRNTALVRATGDVCLFADDDVTYVDNYRDIILKEFNDNPQADVIIFNVISTNKERGIHTTSKWTRLHFYNCFRYGTVQIAIRTEQARKSNISFSLLFGGGAKYCCGEDSLFIADCLKSRMRIYASPQTIGTVTQAESTWFKGYTDKYFIDKGALYVCLSKRWTKLLCLQFAVRHRKMFEEHKTAFRAYTLMTIGAKQFKGRGDKAQEA